MGGVRSGESSGSRRSIDESELKFPPGSDKAERVAMRLEAIEEYGRLVIGPASTIKYIGRLVVCFLIGALGLVTLILGADGFVALCAVAVIAIFGIWFPVLTVKRNRRNYHLELTPEAVELIQVTPDGEDTVHHATWSVVDSVTTARFGNRPEAPLYPVLNVESASGSGRRTKRRAFLSPEVYGEKFVLDQPLEVTTWELLDLVTAAHQKFKSKPEASDQ